MEDNIHIRLLLIREILNRLTTEEKQELENILASNPEAVQLRQELSNIPREELEEFIQSFDRQAGLADVYARAQTLRSNRKKTIIRRIATATAAAAAIAAGAIIFLNRQPEQTAPLAHQQVSGSASITLEDGKVIALKDSGLQQHTAFQNNNRVLELGSDKKADQGWSILNVPAKLDYQVKLADGSRVWLNSKSRLRFRFSYEKNVREVYLEDGEAFFQVSASAESPFTVHTPQGSVQVLGTEFNVNAYTENKVTTSLVTGKVAIQSGIDRIELRPGHEAIVNAGEPIKVETFDARRTLGWRQGIHYFEKASIASVAVMLERWFDTPLIIDNPAVAKENLWGQLNRNEPLQVFIDQVNLTGDVHFYWKDGALHCR
ncbi:FecR domain-containing protein [Chitinophaga sp. YIM B06452]|uniref:FecR family protein n=1 Tax=Chitinophaga sp. YIM B06452 TaxID=3082158 RepID=UPI0031FEFE4F